MKIIYMGTPDFAVEALEALASSRHEVTAVFTQPDKPKGRGKAMQFTPVKEVALRENIPVYQPKKVRDPEVIQSAWFTFTEISRSCSDPVGGD